MEKINFTISISINIMLKYALVVLILLSAVISLGLLEKPFIELSTKIETSANISDYDEASIKQLAHTKMTRSDFAHKVKPMIKYYIEKNEYDKLYTTLDVNDLGIILTTLMITETSTKMDDGFWYPFNSDLVDHHNLFGIKDHSGKGVNKQTWEHYNGKNVIIRDNFKVYNSYGSCIADWVNKMKKKRYKPVIKSANWSAAFINLQACGYMTDPKYPYKAIRIVQDNDIEELWKN